MALLTKIGAGPEELQSLFQTMFGDTSNTSKNNTATNSGINLVGGSAKPADPSVELADIQKQLQAISFKGSLGDRKNFGANIEGSPLRSEFLLAIELADKRDRLLGKEVQNRGTIGGPNTPGEVALLIQTLVGGGNIKTAAETTIQKEQRLQEATIEAKGAAQATEQQARSEIITERAAGPQTLFKREGEIPRATQLGGGRRT